VGRKRVALIATIVPTGAALVLTGCQTTGNHTESPIAVSGLPLRLVHYAALNPDCSSIGDTVVRVLREPSHGVVTIRNGSGYTNFVAANSRHDCNFRPTAGTNVSYVSNPGYTGPDSVSLDAIYPVGQEIQSTFNLTVK
jgi:hypothetical protein